MATLSEIVYNIQNFIEGGRIQVDSIPSYEQLVFNVNIQRAKWARRDINKNGYISDTWQQDLGCVELELVDSAQCCTIESGCDILRTVNKLPRLVRLYNRDAITFVGSIDKQSSYAVINPNSAKYAEYEKYTGSQKRFFLLNQYGFLTNSKTQKYINVRGVFTDPRQAAWFVDCDDEPCWTEDDEYPMPEDLIDLMTDDFLNNKIKIITEVKQDLINDAKDEETRT